MTMKERLCEAEMSYGWYFLLEFIKDSQSQIEDGLQFKKKKAKYR